MLTAHLINVSGYFWPYHSSLCVHLSNVLVPFWLIVVFYILQCFFLSFVICFLKSVLKIANVICTLLIWSKLHYKLDMQSKKLFVICYVLLSCHALTTNTSQSISTMGFLFYLIWFQLVIFHILMFGIFNPWSKCVVHANIL